MHPCLAHLEALALNHQPAADSGVAVADARCQRMQLVSPDLWTPMCGQGVGAVRPNCPVPMLQPTGRIRYAGPDRGSPGMYCAALARCCQTLARASMPPASAALPLPRC